MRRLYREHLSARLRRGDVLWLARRAARYASVHVSKALGRPLSGPILGTIITNYSCNLRCSMCDLPLRVGRYGKEGLTSLSTQELLRVIDDFAAIGTLGIGFTGGEPMLRKDLFDLLARSRERGMITHLNTNGTFVDDDAVDRLFEIGVDSVNLSLDGADAATHDAVRAHEGSFREVVDAAGRILARRDAKKIETPRVKLVCVLGNHNIDQTRRLVALRREIGADSIDFIPVHDFDAPGSQRDRPRPEDTERAAARAAVATLSELAKTEPIDNSPGHLRLLPRALAGEPSPLRCYAGYNSLAVDGYGRIFPCVPWSNQDRASGNVRETPLRDFWRSREYGKTRREVGRCTDCYLNCQTELNLLFQRSPKS